MGLDYPSCQFLLSAKKQGANFNDALTLGRQAIFLAGLEHQHLGIDSADVPSLLLAQPADLFLKKYLGVANLVALDNSDYEGASIRHDLNEPVPDSLHERFDAVIDGGTVEHVFNYPRAIWNAVQMTRVGGRIFFFTPANNYFGHGFYQFSPELFFSLCDSNPCIQVKRLVAVTYDSQFGTFPSRHKYFEVASPIAVGGRVGLHSQSKAVMLFVEICKNDHAPTTPINAQQSDYVTRWSTDESSVNSPIATQFAASTSVVKRFVGRVLFRTFRVVHRRMPSRLTHYIRILVMRHYVFSLRNGRFFKPLRSL